MNLFMVKFALRHPRDLLCDFGFPCKKHRDERLADMVALSEIADIVYGYELVQPEAALHKIKAVLDGMTS